MVVAGQGGSQARDQRSFGDLATVFMSGKLDIV